MNNDSIFRILLAVILFTGVGISITYRRKADKESGEKVSKQDEDKQLFLALRLGGLVLWLSPIAYVVNPAWMVWSKIGLADSMRWTGVGLGVICVGLISWLFSSIGAGITPTVATRTEHKLVKHGPYRWVRHPLYTIGTSFIISLGLMADNWFILAAAVIAFLLLVKRTPNEETHLIEKFGDEYRNYMKTTGAFLPNLLG
jgi:protein-S-isoprenylcysteine O-methyltransferase Ste14